MMLFDLADKTFLNEKKQTTIKRNNNSESNKATSVSKCSPDAYGSVSGRAPPGTGVCRHTHTLLTLDCFHIGELI